MRGLPLLILWSSTLLGGALVAVPAHAQEPVTTLSAGVRIELRLDTPIDTRRTRTGDPLSFTLLGSDCVDGRRLAGGAVIDGRVVHAQKAGMFGKAAELLVSAGPWRPEGAGAIVRLRNLHARAGRSRDAAAVGVAVVAGPFAAFVRGGHIVLPAGTGMAADNREPIDLPAAAFEACSNPSPEAEAYAPIPRSTDSP